jgi:hypothetical protein
MIKRGKQLGSRTGQTRDPNKQIVVLCEGETEKSYLEALIRAYPRIKDHMNVHVFATACNTLSLVDEALYLKDKKQNKSQIRNKIDKRFYEKAVIIDHIWVITDYDNRENGQLTRAYQKAKAQNIGFLWSNVSFEMFLLLHFNYIESNLSNEELNKKLQKQFFDKLNIQYNKNKTAFEDLIQKDFPESAIKNGETLSKKWQIELSSGQNLEQIASYTNLHDFVKAIKDVDQHYLLGGKAPKPKV